MKRYAVFAILGLFIIAGAVAVYAADRHSPSRLTINPSEMKDGESKTFTDEGRKVTVRRDGDTTHVTIEGAEGTKTLSITSDGSGIRIDRDGVERRKIVIGSDRLLEGFPRHEMLPRKAQTWFVCPKDKAMLRVPEEKADETFKCPVDGTTMEKRKGRGFAFFFDDDVFESHDM
ncbi:MAG: hypothetical protein AABO58_22690 [Acidobacteriota bacterium]